MTSQPMHKCSQFALVDSNILVYSLNSSSTKFQVAQDFLQASQNRLCVTQQNIFESIRILTHKKFAHPMTVEQAIAAITNITNQLTVLTPLPETEHVALDLLTKYKTMGLKVFDTYLAATAITHGVTTIATDNEKDFRKIFEVKVFNPFK